MLTRETGFSYPIALFLVAVVGLMSARAVEHSATMERRLREAELLSIGKAYRDVIRSYYEGSPGTAKTYPDTLEALLSDPRATRLRRPLRKLYRDPINGGAAWGIVRDEAGLIKGVYSTSQRKPIKTDGFPMELIGFANAKTYSEWVFVHEVSIHRPGAP